jgi:hypothetical protein
MGLILQDVETLEQSKAIAGMYPARSDANSINT